MNKRKDSQNEASPEMDMIHSKVERPFLEEPSEQ